MIEYLLVLARKQIRCPLPDCLFLFVSKLNSPLIICSYAVVLCIACEDHLWITAVESGRRRGKWTGERWSIEEKGYGCPLKLFFPICSFGIKLISRYQCMDAPRTQAAGSLWWGGQRSRGKKIGSEIGKLGNQKGRAERSAPCLVQKDLKILSPNSSKGTPDK